MRKLTTEEIDYLLEDIPACFPDYLLPDQKRALLEPMMARLRRDLSAQSVHDDFTGFSEVKDVLMKKTEGAIVEAGEGVGILCAQSIGERQTQLTLNSFHSSGLCVATVVTGVPRFLELLNATKEPKTAFNSFLLDTITGPSEIRRLIGDSLVFFNLHGLVLSENIFLAREDDYWFGAFETVYGNRFRDYQAGITFRLDIEKLYHHKISLTTVKEKIEKAFIDIACVVSPLYIAQIDIFVDTTDIFVPDGLPLVTGDRNHVLIYLEQVVRPRLLEIEICGIRGITGYHYQKTDDRWRIQTQGSNFTEVLCLPFVGIEGVTSNNMWDIYNSFGIEATREFLVDEFTGVVSSDGTFINPAHIVLLVDIMTHQGTINSVSRYGMKKEQMGVLSRSSFEESLDHFCNAGSYAEKDVLQSVSANIMCGKRAEIGSGMCGVRMDWDVILANDKKKSGH
jgi:DNA-directed RNA polymerase beta' subunit